MAHAHYKENQLTKLAFISKFEKTPRCARTHYL
jgi:hypothetical protein